MKGRIMSWTFRGTFDALGTTQVGNRMAMRSQEGRPERQFVRLLGRSTIPSETHSQTRVIIGLGY